MSINLLECDSICHGCVKQYICKHTLKKGEKFQISCVGIPKDLPSSHLFAESHLDASIAESILDPMKWANTFLDWHCLDPEGEIWHRKTLNGTLGAGQEPFDEEMAAIGKSPFHRPYQSTMLRCSSRFKVFRIGRQAGKTTTLCVSILYNLATHDDWRIVVVAPYQSQVDLIFDNLTSMLKASPSLCNSVRRSVKAPNYALQLNNGSKVLGFTAGTKSGQEAGSVRGQPANMLVFDEADYLSRKDLDSVLMTITNSPRATVWMSSTPTGRREKFYESCHSKKYKEFHYASDVNPNWTQELDEYYREELTEEGYEHEVLAGFGEQEQGVFKVKYVEAARADYSYDEMSPNPKWIYSIGVDWNDYRVGNVITIIGYNPEDQQFYLVLKNIISSSEFTQLKACLKLAELNRIWNPFAIYVDRGYGSGQIEVLHKYGYDAMADKSRGPKSADAKLSKIVKPYEFGGKIETYDLFTKQPIAKPSKPFLVENLVRRFETYTLHFPKTDEKLIASLQGYVVKRIAQSGSPIYEQQNEKAGDHLIDSIGLAMVAFTLEKSEFGKPKMEIGVGFTQRIGEKEIIFEGGPRRPPKTEARSNLLQEGTNSAKGLPMNGQVREPQKIWSWPGWERDEPRPQVKSFRQKWIDAENKMGGRRSRKPKRTKF